MNINWNEYVVARCQNVLTGNDEYLYKEGTLSDEKLLHNEAKILCYLAGMYDAMKLLGTNKKIDISHNNIIDRCNKVLDEDIAYKEFLICNEDIDIIYAKEECICYETGFKDFMINNYFNKCSQKKCSQKV